MDIITYHASDMEMLQSDSLPFAVQIKHRNSYASSSAGQTAVAADMRFFPGFDGGGSSYTKHRTVPSRAVPRIRFNPLPFLLVLSIVYAVLAGSLLRGGAGAYSIRRMTFSEEPSFSRALHSYIFPEQDGFTE